VHMLDHGLAVDQREWLAGESGRLVPRRNHGDDSGGSERRWEPSGQNDGHGEW
jgi:hypothetical protein